MDEANPVGTFQQDSDEVRTMILKEIGQIYSKVTSLVNYRFYFLIYKLIKTGKIGVSDMADATHLSRERIYQIIDIFEKKRKE